MSTGIGKCSKILHIVRLRQMLRQWRNKAKISANRLPPDVPAGHVAVCVGTNCTRYVVRATYLNHPIFKSLLVRAEEEYGFSHQGPLLIPCDESVFEEVIRHIARFESGNSARYVNLEDCQRYCHVGIRSNLDFWPESRPLLPSSGEKTIWTDRVKNPESIVIRRRIPKEMAERWRTNAFPPSRSSSWYRSLGPEFDCFSRSEGEDHY